MSANTTRAERAAAMKELNERIGHLGKLLGESQYDHGVTARQLQTAEAALSTMYAVRDEMAADLAALRSEVERLTRRFNEERARANEAAKLSAAARDEADDLRKVIADQREHIAIVEGDRTDFDAWTSNVCHEFGLDPLGDGRGDIADLLRRLTRELDSMIQLCDAKAAERDSALELVAAMKPVVEAVHAAHNDLYEVVDLYDYPLLEALLAASRVGMNEGSE